ADHPVVPVLAAEPDIALDGEHLEPLAGEAHEGDVERPAAEVVDHDGARLSEFRLRSLTLPARRLTPAVQRPLERVRQGRGGGLVEDVDDLQPGDRPASLVALRRVSSKYAGAG